MSALRPGEKKKVDKLTLILLGGLAVFVLYVAAAVGAALDMSVVNDGDVDRNLFIQNIAVTIADPDVVFSALGSGGYAPKMLFFAVVAIGIYALYKYSMIKKRLHRKGVEHGSAQWGDDTEMQSLKDREFISKNKKTGIPNYGKANEPKFIPLLKSDGTCVFDKAGDFVGVLIDNNIILTKQVYMSLNARQHLMNLNVLIIGGSGSGKTRFYAKPNILQLNTSYVITDPKGEILQALGGLIVKAGYDLKVFNTIEMEHSNNYNPFHYVYDYEGNLSEDLVTKMIDVFMQNTKGEGEKDDFWSQSATKVITAIIFLLFEESEYNIEFDKDGKVKPETRDKSSLNFFSVTEKMRKLQYPPQGKEDGFFMQQNDGESPEEYQKRREAAFLCPLDKDFIRLENKKGALNLAVRLYKEVRNSPQETGQSILATAGARTQMFNLKKLCDLTCCDNIKLETLGDKKSALFIIISATNSTYNFLAAMMYSQMFDVLANRANFMYGGVLPVPVRCIMDEFANIGEIPDFDKVIAFVRSMGMSLNVIIQNLAQLKARYEKTWEIITGNCDSLLFLGGKETSTLKDISEALGKETIDLESKNRTITGGHKSDSTAESNSILGRELLTQDELQKIPIGDCVLMIRSHNPFYCNKFPLEQHPNFKFTEDFDKSLAFDKYSIKVTTLQEFGEQNNRRAAGGKPADAEDGENESNDTTRSKLERTFPKPGEEKLEVSSKSVDFIFETYADAAEFADGENDGGVDIVEIYAQDPEDYKKYGIPSELESLDMPAEPEREEVEDDEVHVEVSLNADNDEDNSGGWGKEYGEVSEPDYVELNEETVEDMQCHLAGLTEIYAADEGYNYNVDGSHFTLSS